jgi:uncharacterized repeat protein (TIGR04052 family)
VSVLPNPFKTRRWLASACVLAAALGAVACNDSSSPDPLLTPLKVNFAAKVAATPFVCGSTYPGIGTSSATVSVEDFRLYVSNFRTLDAAGKEHPVSLVSDKKWQSSSVALLDFENANGPCGELGTTETNTSVSAAFDGSDVAALRFSLGVPESEAHQNVGIAAAPLSLGSMFWGWQAGYKYLRVDFSASGTNPAVPASQWLIHIGSTGCQSAASSVAPTTACARANRAEVTLVGWQPSKTVVVDLASLLANVDVLNNTPATAPGCMSDPEDPECKLVIPNLGLDIVTGQCAGGCAGQKLFRLE